MIAVSSCLLGIPCKYNGGDNAHSEVIAYLSNKQFIAICPECSGGLPIPRVPSELIGGDGSLALEGMAKVVDRLGTDVTEAFLKGAKHTLEAISRNACDLVILKANSPSCGVGKIYDGSFSGKLVEGDGVTAALLKKAGYHVITEKSIKELVDKEENR